MFPAKTSFNKIMPKSKFLKMTDLSTQARKEFEENVDRLILANILRKDTINIEAGETVSEIDVLEILLKQKQLSDKVIREIDSNIPKSIIFYLRYDDKAQLAISFKERGKENFKVVKIYRTEWLNHKELKLEIRGLNLDSVFCGFIEQIADGKIELNEETNIKEAVEKSVDREKLEKQILQLENKLKKEKQFNKQLEIKNQLKELKRRIT